VTLIEKIVWIHTNLATL